MSKSYPNFYENLKEAQMRLQQTVVLYDGSPYYVLAIDDHKSDGIFRIYMDDIGHPQGVAISRGLSIPFDCMVPDGTTRGAMMDTWLEANPDKGVIRKQLNSPLFNKFRPFPLGMMNTKYSTLYVERQPQRHTQQGLTSSMLVAHPINLDAPEPTPVKSKYGVELLSATFRSCVVGQYPSMEDCIQNLKDTKIANRSAAFHRQFALVRGPLETLFLAYKSDIIGVLPNKDKSVLHVGKNFHHLKEIVEEALPFGQIILQ